MVLRRLLIIMIYRHQEIARSAKSNETNFFIFTYTRMHRLISRWYYSVFKTAPKEATLSFVVIFYNSHNFSPFSHRIYIYILSVNCITTQNKWILVYTRMCIKTIRICTSVKTISLFPFRYNLFRLITLGSEFLTATISRLRDDIERVHQRK